MSNLLAHEIAQRHYNLPFAYIRIARVGDEHVVEHDDVVWLPRKCDRALPV